MDRFASELALILKNRPKQGREGENQALILKNDQKQGREEAHASKPMATLGRVRGRGPECVPVRGHVVSGGTRSEATKGLEVCASSPEYAITEETWDGTEAVKQPEGVLILDADKAGEYTEGAWKSGDWIKPLGAPGRKKLQDWFTDHHIPADEKPFIPLLKSAVEPHHVLAVIPYCIDHSVRVTSSTRRILRICAKND